MIIIFAFTNLRAMGKKELQKILFSCEDLKTINNKIYNIIK